MSVKYCFLFTLWPTYRLFITFCSFGVGIALPPQKSRNWTNDNRAKDATGTLFAENLRKFKRVSLILGRWGIFAVAFVDCVVGCFCWWTSKWAFPAKAIYFVIFSSKIVHCIKLHMFLNSVINMPVYEPPLSRQCEVYDHCLLGNLWLPSLLVNALLTYNTLCRPDS